MVQGNREKEQEQKHINETENIFKGCTVENVRNYDQMSSSRPDSGTSWNYMHPVRFQVFRVLSRQLQIFKIPEREEFHAAPLSSHT